MRRSVRRQLLLLIDLGLIALGTLLALILRDDFVVSTNHVQDLLPYLGMTLISSTVVLFAAGLHRSIWRYSAMVDYLRVLGAVLVSVVAAGALAFQLNHLDGVARALPVIQALLMAFLLIGARVAMRLRRARRHQAAASHSVGEEETILVIGINTLTDLFLRSVAELAPERVKIAGLLGRSQRHSGRFFQQYPVLGVPEEIEDILKTLDIHGVSIKRIVVTSPFTELSRETSEALRDLERTSDIQLDFFAERLGLDRRSDGLREPEENDPAVDHDPSLAFSAAELKAELQRPYFRVKRVIDFTAATLLAILATPLIALVGLAVALDMGFPVIFWQQRPGLHGRPFKLYKFRTMRDAHDQRGRRIADELRLSPIGRLLRRTRLDELPQIYNILLGEMSFIGPRPLLPVDQSAAHAARLLARPGLTGWAQVCGGRAISPRDKAALDIWYVRNASLWLDLKILARTLPVVLIGERVQTDTVRQACEELACSHVFPGTRGGGGSSSAELHSAN